MSTTYVADARIFHTKYDINKTQDIEVIKI